MNSIFKKIISNKPAMSTIGFILSISIVYLISHEKIRYITIIILFTLFLIIQTLLFFKKIK